ncbi:MAG: AraC family ligand binding domain-containing protein [Candidatus Dormibacteria bacterium]
MSEFRAEGSASPSAAEEEVEWVVALAQLRAGKAYGTSDHAAVTLHKHPDMTVVLVALKAGGQMPQHQTDATISIQPVEGEVRVGVGGRTHRLGPGRLLVLGPGLSHTVFAPEPSAFLLTVGVSHHGINIPGP